MNNNTLVGMTVLVVVGIGLLLLINLMSSLPQTSSSSKKHIEHGDVRGSAVFHDQKEYPLNFDQQNLLIDLLNNSTSIGKPKSIEKGTPLEIDKIVIYRFNAPDVVITPLFYINNELLFSAPVWSPEGPLRDNSRGALKDLLSQTFDK